MDKGVETGSTTTHFGPACAQTMPHLPKALFTCLWQVELLWTSHGKQT